MLFLLILTLCYSVSSFDLEKTRNNLRDGNLVNGLLDGFTKNKENREEIVENLGKFEKNMRLLNGLSGKNPLADFGFGRNADVPTRPKREAEPNSVPLNRFCRRVDWDCCCHDCGESDCDSDLPDSFDWSQHIAMPAKMRNSSDYVVASVIADYVSLLYAFKHKRATVLAAEQLTDCRESLEDHLDWTGALTRLMIQGGFELESEYQADTTDARCRFHEYKAAVNISTCYQINIEKENCLRSVLFHLGPVLVGLRKENSNVNIDSIITDCDAARDTYTPHILVGYGQENGSDIWVLLNSDDFLVKMLRGVACQDIGMNSLILSIY